MMIQSNCFIVVERGAGMANLMPERQLADSGQRRQNSNMGGGQMVSADFVIPPRWSSPRTMPAASAPVSPGCSAPCRGGGRDRRWHQVKGRRPHAGRRRPERRAVAAAEGSTKKADLALGGALFGGGGGGAHRRQGNTDEARSSPRRSWTTTTVWPRRPQRCRPAASVGTLKAEAAAGGATKSGAVSARATCS